MNANQNETLARSVAKWVVWENILVVSITMVLLFFAQSGQAFSPKQDGNDSSEFSKPTQMILGDSEVLESEIKKDSAGTLSRVRHVLIGAELVRIEDEVNPQAATMARLMDYSRFRVHVKAGSAAFTKLLSTVARSGASVIPTDSPEVFLISYKEKSLSLQERLRMKIKRTSGVLRLESLAKST
jgi:hypothetical protein